MEIFKYAKGYKMKIVFLVVMMVVISISDVLITYQYVNLDAANGVFNEIVQIMITIVAGSMIVKAIDYIVKISMKKISNGIMKSVQNETIDNICHANVQFVEGYQKGEIINRLTDDLEAISQVYDEIVPATIKSFVYIIAAFFTLANINAILCITAALVLVIYLICFLILNKRIILRYRSCRGASDSHVNFVEDIVSGISDIRNWEILNQIKLHFEKVQDNYLTSDFRLFAISEGTQSVYAIIKWVANTLIVTIGFLLIAKKAIGVGALIAVILYLNNLYTPVMDFFDSANDFNKCKENLRRIFEFKDENKKQNEVHGKLSEDRINSIEFKNICFSYGKERVINQLNAKLEAGKKYALIGQTGCGKTTFLKLLSGYYKPISGTIEINGNEIVYDDYTDIISKTYPVLQDTYMFNLVLKDEIQLYGNKDDGDEEILNKMRLAEISELRERIEEHVGNNGGELSGGQRQRVILTRIFSGERDLLILDESTSALDAETESRVLETVWKYFANSIVVVCTHNDAILSKVDCTLVMKEGKIEAK